MQSLIGQEKDHYLNKSKIKYVVGIFILNNITAHIFPTLLNSFIFFFYCIEHRQKKKRKITENCNNEFVRVMQLEKTGVVFLM